MLDRWTFGLHRSISRDEWERLPALELEWIRILLAAEQREQLRRAKAVGDGGRDSGG